MKENHTQLQVAWTRQISKFCMLWKAPRIVTCHKYHREIVNNSQRRAGGKFKLKTIYLGMLCGCSLLNLNYLTIKCCLGLSQILLPNGFSCGMLRSICSICLPSLSSLFRMFVLCSWDELLETR